MAGVVDLRGAAQDRKMRQLLMMQEYRNKSGVLGGESAIDKFLADQEEEAKQKREENRKTYEFNTRMQQQGREHEEKIKEYNQNYELKQRTQNFGEWEATERVKRGQEESGRGEKSLGLEERRTSVQERTGEAAVGTEKEKQLTEQQKREMNEEWSRQQRQETYRKMAIETWNRGVQQRLAGNKQMFDVGTDAGKNNTQLMEDAGKVLYGPDFQLERDQYSGQWTPDEKKLALTMMNEKGEPSADFLKTMNEADKPGTPFESWLKAMNKAIADGDTFAQQMLTDRMRKDVLPNLGETEGGMVDDLVKNKDIPGALKMIDQITAAKTRVKASTIPAGKIQAEQNSLINLYSTLGNTIAQFDDLIKKKKTPTGRLHVPYIKWLESIEVADPEVQTFLGNQRQIVSRYINEVTGKQSNESEREDLKRAHPNENDNVKVFRHRMMDMQKNLLRTMRQNKGYWDEIGIQTPDLGVPAIKPSETIARWGPGGFYQVGDAKEGNFIDRSEFAGYEAGKPKVAAQMKEQGTGVGGINERRDKPGVKAPLPGASPLADIPTEDLLKMRQATP